MAATSGIAAGAGSLADSACLSAFASSPVAAICASPGTTDAALLPVVTGAGTGSAGRRSLITIGARALDGRNGRCGGGKFRRGSRGGAGGRHSGRSPVVGNELQRRGRRRQARERLMVDAQRREHAESTAQRDHGSRDRTNYQTKVGKHRTSQKKSPRATRRSTCHNGRKIIAREKDRASPTAP